MAAWKLEVGVADRARAQSSGTKGSKGFICRSDQFLPHISACAYITRALGARVAPEMDR